VLVLAVVARDMAQESLSCYSGNNLMCIGNDVGSS